MRPRLRFRTGAQGGDRTRSVQLHRVRLEELRTCGEADLILECGVMRLKVLHFSLFVCVTAVCDAQPRQQEPQLAQRGEPQYLFRILSTDYLGSLGFERSCVIGYPNNYFHFEHSKQAINEERPRAYFVSEGRFTDDEALKALSVLQDPELANYQNHVKPVDGILTVNRVSRLLSAEIPRDRYQTQVVIADNIVRKATPRAVKPLADLIDALVGRRPPITPNALPNNCKSPRARPLRQ